MIFAALIVCAPAGPGQAVDAAETTNPSLTFSAVDTSRLMGSPDPLPPMKFERAFPRLRIARPVQPTHAGDGSGRMFVATQDGRILVFPNDPAVDRATTFLDIHERVTRPAGDNGLLAVAFHQNFQENGLFYVVYTTRATPKSTVISRFRVSASDPDTADPRTETELLRIRQPFADHNAACLAFGPDGMLYIALGDGGYNIANSHAQDRSTLLGCMLRIDVDRREGNVPYVIPEDNPFVRDPSTRGEIWCYGLRAPWRFSFDRVTGECWLGDNGQVEFEEINLIEPGRNYGWMAREGFHAFDPSHVDPRGRLKPGPILPRPPETGRNDGFTDPLFEYDHTQGKSVVGGHVYRGTQLPQLIGAYVYGDFVNGNIWSLRRTDNDIVDIRLVAGTQLQMTSFGEDEFGELYFTSFDGFVYRLRPAERTENPNEFPRTLSETGLFTSVPALTPAPGLIPYSVNVPLWSDDAVKQRYVALPAANSVEFRRDGAWEFPVGTVFIKTFLIDAAGNSASGEASGNLRRLETRLLVRNPREWAGYTYRWNEDQTDAVLLGGAATANVQSDSNGSDHGQSWYFPSRSDCIACHTRAAGFVLGVNTRQLNRQCDGPAAPRNQLTLLQHLRVFTVDLPDSPDQLPAWPDWNAQSGSVHERARAYLDVNCAMCHTPPGFTKLNLRGITPLKQTGLLREDPEKPRIGPADSKLILPGHPDRSELLLRMLQTGPGRMPNMATSVVDETACEVIREWIRTMPR